MLLIIVIEDGKFSTGWVGDIDNRPETDTAKLRQKRIFVHELYAQPKASQALIDDAAINVDNWLVVESLRNKNAAFINGDGDKKPKGILSQEHRKIEQFTIANEITTDKLLDFINLLDEDYLANASFLMNRINFSGNSKTKRFHR
ncbi:MAG: phage major capsid protein [Candidatus Rickettsia vulgarisii]